MGLGVGIGATSNLVQACLIGWPHKQCAACFIAHTLRFADAAVYGVALYAVGRSVKLQVRAAHWPVTCS